VEAKTVSCTVNGVPRSIAVRQGLTLMKYLREDLKLTGTKCGCGAGDCGACKVLVDGKARTSCNLPVTRLEGVSVLTVEGLSPEGSLEPVHPVQRAFIDSGAVQCGFCTPGMVITAVDLLERNPKPNEAEIREAFAGNLCRCTGYAKIVDAVLIASGQKLPPERGEGVGGSAVVAEAEAKVSGRLKYAADIELPRMAFGKILYAPAAHGIVTSLDASEAEALPGVLAVVSFLNSPDREYNSHVTVPYQKVPKNERIFNRHFRYAGDRVAAVAAVDETTAARALKLIRVEYEPLPVAASPEAATAESAYAIHEGGNLAAQIAKSGGGAAGTPAGETLYSGVFRTQRVTHAAMEPHVVVAEYDGRTLSVHTPCQNVFCYQAMLAELFDLPFSSVRVDKPPVGGAFGGKSEMVLEPVAALLALRTGRPIKMTMTRREVFRSTRTRTPSRIEATIGVSDDGLFTRHLFKAVLDRGAYFGSGFDLGYALMNKAFRLYRAQRIEAAVDLVYTNNQPPGAMRGYGNPQLSFARELLIDRICAERGWDPVDFRLANLVRPGDVNLSDGASLGACLPADCLSEGARRFDWKRKRAEYGLPRSSAPAGAVLRGVGVASGVHGAGIYPSCTDYSTVSLKAFPDGSFVLGVTAHENGQGSSVVMRKLAAESLGVSESRIALMETDTHVTYYDNGSYASRETWVCGQAVLGACSKIKSLLAAEAAELSGLPADRFSCSGGVFRAEEPGSPSYSISDLVRHAQTTYPFTDIAVVESVPSPYDPGAYFANFAEVEIRRDTGAVRVVEFLAVHNSGTPINPLMIEGQVEGGLQMGLGFALSEKVEVDEETGAILTGSFKDYRVFRAADMPRVESVFLDDPEPAGPYGAKSIGEATTGGVAPAVVNAIRHATGCDFSELPVTVGKIAAALREKGLLGE